MAGRILVNRIRLGILALPIAGAMELATTVLVWSGDTSADRDWAELVISVRYEVAQLTDLLALVLYLFGAFALYAYLARTRAEHWAIAGLILGVVYLVSLIVVTAIDTQVEPFVGQQYLEGRQSAVEIYEPRGQLPGFVSLTYDWSGYASFAFFSIAIWRSRLLPQGTVILLGAFAILTPVAFTVNTRIGFLGYLLIAIAEMWVAWVIWRQLAPAGARSRVR